jgi:hypothetical protein
MTLQTTPQPLMPAGYAATRQALTAARYAAYRRLALSILGADVPTLITELRERREASPPDVRPLPPIARAA